MRNALFTITVLTTMFLSSACATFNTSSYERRVDPQMFAMSADFKTTCWEGKWQSNPEWTDAENRNAFFNENVYYFVMHRVEDLGYKVASLGGSIYTGKGMYDGAFTTNGGSRYFYDAAVTPTDNELCFEVKVTNIRPVSD